MSAQHPHSAHPSLERLAAFAEQELPDAEQQELRLHLEGCSSCQERLDELTSLTTAVQRLPRLDAPTGFSSRVMARLDEEAVPGWLRFLRRWRIFQVGSVVAVAAATLLLLRTPELRQASMPALEFAQEGAELRETRLAPTERSGEQLSKESRPLEAVPPADAQAAGAGAAGGHEDPLGLAAQGAASSVAGLPEVSRSTSATALSLSDRGGASSPPIAPAAATPHRRPYLSVTGDDRPAGPASDAKGGELRQRDESGFSPVPPPGAGVDRPDPVLQTRSTDPDAGTELDRLQKNEATPGVSASRPQPVRAGGDPVAPSAGPEKVLGVKAKDVAATVEAGRSSSEGAQDKRALELETGEIGSIGTGGGGGLGGSRAGIGGLGGTSSGYGSGAARVGAAAEKKSATVGIEVSGKAGATPPPPAPRATIADAPAVALSGREAEATRSEPSASVKPVAPALPVSETADVTLEESPEAAVPGGGLAGELAQAARQRRAERESRLEAAQRDLQRASEQDLLTPPDAFIVIASRSGLLAAIRAEVLRLEGTAFPQDASPSGAPRLRVVLKPGTYPKLIEALRRLEALGATPPPEKPAAVRVWIEQSPG